MSPLRRAIGNRTNVAVENGAVVCGTAAQQKQHEQQQHHENDDENLLRWRAVQVHMAYSSLSHTHTLPTPTIPLEKHVVYTHT